jgi:hypothetical protein
MTVKSKLLLKAFYDEPLKYSYFKGCSTGGRQALMEAQRYPLDYDAIIAGAPSNRQIHIASLALERSIRLVRNPDHEITQTKANLIQQNSNEHMRHAERRVPEQSSPVQHRLHQNPLRAGKRYAHMSDGDRVGNSEELLRRSNDSKGELVLAGQAWVIP